jgi:DNA-binding transcriptional LysR family regulator
MDVRYLKTFVALAEARNVTRTAERLDYAPSSVTAHVHALEHEVGFPLMERTGRGIALTGAGRAFLSHAKRIIDAERTAIAELRTAGVPATTVSVGSAGSIAAFILPRVVARVRAADPHVSISTRQGQCTDHLPAVAAGELDIAFTLERQGDLERQRDATMATETLAPVAIVAVAAPHHRVARLAHVDASALSGETLIDSEPGCSYREAFAAYLDDAGVQVGARIEFDNFEPIRRCAIDGVGVALVPRFVVADALEAGTLVELPLRAPGQFVIAATWRPAGLTAAARAVLEAARAETCTKASSAA